MQIARLDWIVLFAYLVVIAVIGLVAGLRVKDTDQYFLGNRRFGKWLMIGQSFGIGTHAEMPVSLAGAVYTMGASGIWFHWKNLFATPFYWIMAPIFRRIRRTTIAEMTQDRYGLWMGGIYSFFALCFFTLNTASMLKGAAKVINQAVGGEVGVDRVVIAMTVIFIFYSFVGGLLATAWTDFFQGFLIIALSFLLIPMGWTTVGGLTGMKESLPAYKFSLAAPEGITLWIIVMLTLNGLIGIMAQPHMLAAVGTGKDERTCRVGFMYGNFVKRFCTVGWALVGLIVAAMVAQGQFGVSSLADPEDAFGFACRQLLFPGSLGLLIASVLAANMSTCSAFMVDSGALFTQGLFRTHISANRSDRYYLWIGRVSGLVITMLGVLYALFLIERVLYAFLLTETLATYMGISLIGGIVWARANRWGALASLVASLSTNFLLYYSRGERLDHWDADVFFLSFLAGVAGLVIFSLLTSPEPRLEIDSFYGRLQSPADVGRPDRSDTSVTALAGLDAAALSSPRPTQRAAELGQQSLLVNLLQLRKGSARVGFWRAYRIDLTGLAIGWLLAAGLVLGTWLLFRL